MLGKLATGLALALAFAATAAAQDLVFAVTEGVTYQATPKEIREKFAPLADVIAKATGRRVRTVLVPAYNDARAGLATQEFDVAYLHPAHVPMAEIKAGRYKAIAWTQGFTEYTASELIPGTTLLGGAMLFRRWPVATPWLQPRGATATRLHGGGRAGAPGGSVSRVTPAMAAKNPYRENFRPRPSAASIR